MQLDLIHRKVQYLDLGPQQILTWVEGSWHNVLKVYKTDSGTLGKLNMYVQVHNLAQEEMVDVATMVLEYQAQKTYQLYHKDMSLS